MLSNGLKVVIIPIRKNAQLLADRGLVSAELGDIERMLGDVAAQLAANPCAERALELRKARAQLIDRRERVLAKIDICDELLAASQKRRGEQKRTMKEDKETTKMQIPGKGEPELEVERAKVVKQIEEIDRELAARAERYAAELAAWSPNAQTLEEIEEIRTRLQRERGRLRERVKAIDLIAIPAAKQRASHETMTARVAEDERLREKLSKGHALFREGLAMLRRIDAELPWGETDHPAALLAVLREEIAHDAIEAGESKPELATIPSVPIGELQELYGLARRLMVRVECVRVNFGPLTARGKLAHKRKFETASNAYA